MKSVKKYPEAISFKGANDLPLFPMTLASTECNKTGTWRYLRPRYTEKTPSCQFSCPTGNDIEAWIRLMEKGQVKEAWEAATMENPFPSIMGRVCFHPCMDGCNRCEMGGSVNIQMLERTLGERIGEKLPTAEPFFEPTKKTVAIIGSGPAGLACAYHLNRLGHSVTVFEKEAKAGGMLRYGIPGYRLPKSAVDREITRLKAMGIEIKLSSAVRDAAAMQTLRQDFDAVFMAPGAHKSRRMGIDNENATGIMTGLELLKKAANGKKVSLGKRVLVIGGGNTAMDAARTALRMGSEVKVIYRRTEAEMPAFEDEVREATAEGVSIEPLAQPKIIIMDGNRVTGLTCEKMQLGDPDESGRRRPIPVEGSEATFEANTIITAIGEEIDPSIIPSTLPIANGVIATQLGGRTEWVNVFAGGDFSDGTRTVVDALADGKRSAIAIDCLLHGENFEKTFDKISFESTDHRIGDKGPSTVLMSRYIAFRKGENTATATTSETTTHDDVVRFEDLNSAYFTESKPNTIPMLSVKERLTGDNPEVSTPATEVAVTDEMSRCFHCGRCTECDNCFIYCPDVAIAKKKDGFDIDYYYCKGCGICMTECPRAAVEMIPEPTEI
jgi:2-oxoacid:acceptor oxidoreductase delta subunit (pyruvate/2-ketoisovalerate family)